MADPLFGKDWKMNSGLSVLGIGSLSPDHETRRYEEIANGYKLTVTGAHKGQPYSWGYTAIYDGQNHPVYGRDDVDSIVAYRLNEYITLGFFFKNNLEGGAYKRTTTTEGNQLTVVASGRNARGAPYFDVIHYSS